MFLLLSRRERRRAASAIHYAALAGLIALAALGALVATGARVQSLFVASETIISDGIAGLPLSTFPGDGGPSPAAPAQGIWSGDGFFFLNPSITPQSRTFTLTNVGGSPLALGGAPAVTGSGASFFQMLSTTCGATLSPGDTCDVVLEVSATADGTTSATLAVPNVPGGVALTRTASGFSPLLVWSGGGTFYIDGTPPATGPFTAQQIFTLTNQGFADATGIAPVIVGPDASAFSLSTTCPAVLPKGDACAVTVTAAATTNGTLSATLVAGGPTSANQPLAGSASGFSPVWAWSGGGPFVLSMPTGYPSIVAQIFTLTNVGNAAGVPPTPAVFGGDTLYDIALASTTCGPSLAPGDTCTANVELVFRGNVPAVSGMLTAGTASVALSGRASGFTVAAAFDPYDRETNSLSAATLPGPVRTFLLRNTGTGLLVASPTPVLTGAGAAAFEIVGSTCGGALAPGDTCNVQVRLAVGAAAGFYAATLEAGNATLEIDGSYEIPWLRLTSNLDSLVLPDIGNQPANPVVATNVINLWNVGSAAISLTGFNGSTNITSTNTANLLPLDGGTLANRCEIVGSLSPGTFCSLRLQRRAADNGTFAAILGLTGISGLAPGNVPTLPVSFTAVGLAPLPTIAYSAPDTQSLAPSVNSATFNRLFHNRGAFGISSINFADFDAAVHAQPPGGGINVSIVAVAAPGRCGGTVTSLGVGAAANCNVAYRVTRPAGRTGTAQILLRHLPSGTQTIVTVNLN